MVFFFKKRPHCVLIGVVLVKQMADCASFFSRLARTGRNIPLFYTGGCNINLLFFVIFAH
jgi:hypothetical protein